MPMIGCICTTVTLLRDCAAALATKQEEMPAARARASAAHRGRASMVKPPRDIVSQLRASRCVRALRPEAVAALDQAYDVVHQKTNNGEQQDDRKQLCDLHCLGELHQEHSEASAGPYEFTDYGAEDREHGRDPEAREQERQTARNDDLREQVQLTRVAGARELDPLGLDRLIASHHIHQHREECND